jgi:hypothetical protein
MSAVAATIPAKVSDEYVRERSDIGLFPFTTRRGLSHAAKPKKSPLKSR